MQVVRVRPEFQCFATWVVGKDGLDENTDPAELSISEQLAADLDAWSERWDATYDPQDPLSSGFEDPDEEKSFVAAGEELARRLARELGAEWKVYYAVNESRPELEVTW